MKSIKFWVGTLAWLGCRTSALFLWILLPSLVISNVSSPSLAQGVTLSVAAGLGTLIPNVTSYWRPSTARWRSFCFGGASWLGSFILLGNNLPHVVMCYLLTLNAIFVYSVKRFDNKIDIICICCCCISWWCQRW